MEIITLLRLNGRTYDQGLVLCTYVLEVVITTFVSFSPSPSFPLFSLLSLSFFFPSFLTFLSLFLFLSIPCFPPPHLHFHHPLLSVPVILTCYPNTSKFPPKVKMNSYKELKIKFRGPQHQVILRVFEQTPLYCTFLRTDPCIWMCEWWSCLLTSQCLSFCTGIMNWFLAFAHSCRLCRCGQLGFTHKLYQPLSSTSCFWKLGTAPHLFSKSVSQHLLSPSINKSFIAFVPLETPPTALMLWPVWKGIWKCHLSPRWCWDTKALASEWREHSGYSF